MIKLDKITIHQAEELASDPELLDRISDTECERAVFRPSDQFLGVYVYGELVGFFLFRQENTSAIEIHINILESGRKHAFKATKMFLKQFKEFSPKEIIKINAKIPVIFEDVYWFAKKCGMQDEGLDRKSYKKHGKIYDRYILGITREEI